MAHARDRQTMSSEPVEIAVLDDYQGVALEMADWSVLNGRASITVFRDRIAHDRALVERLLPFDVVCVMRERRARARQHWLARRRDRDGLRNEGHRMEREPDPRPRGASRRGARFQGGTVAAITPEHNKATVLEAFDTLFNKRDYAGAERFWSDHYIQHSAHIAPGRAGLFDLIRTLPETLRYENQLIVAEGDYVIAHGRFSGNGHPAAWIAADVVRPRRKRKFDSKRRLQ